MYYPMYVPGDNQFPPHDPADGVEPLWWAFWGLLFFPALIVVAQVHYGRKTLHTLELIRLAINELHHLTADIDAINQAVLTEKFTGPTAL